MKKKNFRFLALVLVVIFSLVACQQSISHNRYTYSVGEVESDSSHITESPSLVEPVVEDGLAIWRFIPEKQPAVTIGVVIPENLQFLISSWQSDWEALNRYLWEEEGYQVALIAIGVLDEDSALERQAVQTCMDEEIDLFSCAPLDFAVLPATDQFLDLGQEPYKQELSSIFDHYPEPYWEYVETLYGGIYSVSHAISLAGIWDLTSIFNTSVWIRWAYMERGRTCRQYPGRLGKHLCPLARRRGKNVFGYENSVYF